MTVSEAFPQPQKRELQTALVLGGAGFLGSWVRRHLARLGVEAKVLGHGARQPGDSGSTITATSLRRMLGDECDAVFFLAGSPSVPRSVEDPIRDLHDNASLVVETLEVLRELPSPPSFLFVSSAAVYGDVVQEPMAETHPLIPRSPYGVSKLAAEHYVRLYAETYGVSALSVRPFSVYGPGQRKLVVYDLLRRLLEGEDPLVIQSSPEVARDFVYVEDVARAIVDLTFTAPANGEAYNLASGVATTLSDLATALVSAASVDTTVAFTGSLRLGDPFRWRGDTARAAALGIRCATPLSDGLQRTADWIKHDLQLA